MSTEPTALFWQSLHSTVCVKTKVIPMKLLKMRMSSLQVFFVTTFFLQSFSLPAFCNCHKIGAKTAPVQQDHSHTWCHSPGSSRGLFVWTPLPIPVHSFHSESSKNLQPALSTWAVGDPGRHCYLFTRKQGSIKKAEAVNNVSNLLTLVQVKTIAFLWM